MDVNTDIDIDVREREEVLTPLKHIPALASDKESKHNVGVYFQDIPFNPYTQTAALDFKDAEKAGYFKIDFLNNSIYTDIKDDEHLDRLINTEPMWELLQHEEIVKELAHIHSYYDLVKLTRPISVMELAMVIAMIRPGKRYLVGKSWTEIEKEIWIKPTNDDYYFKKSHSVAYAVSIVVQLNRLVEKLNE